MDLERLTPDAVAQKVALDRNYRPIGRIATVDEEDGHVARIRIAPHREFRRKHPECTDGSYPLDACEIARLWGHSVVLDKDVDELVSLWRP